MELIKQNNGLSIIKLFKYDNGGFCVQIEYRDGRSNANGFMPSEAAHEQKAHDLFNTLVLLN